MGVALGTALVAAGVLALAFVWKGPWRLPARLGFVLAQPAAFALLLVPDVMPATCERVLVATGQRTGGNFVTFPCIELGLQLLLVHACAFSLLAGVLLVREQARRRGADADAGGGAESGSASGSAD